MDPKKKKIVLIIVGLFGITIIISGIAGYVSRGNKPDPCQCYESLNIPTEKVGIGMPLPVEHLSNEDFRKYKACYEEYAGPAGAMIECGKK